MVAQAILPVAVALLAAIPFPAGVVVEGHGASREVVELALLQLRQGLREEGGQVRVDQAEAALEYLVEHQTVGGLVAPVAPQAELEVLELLPFSGQATPPLKPPCWHHQAPFQVLP